MPVAYHRDVRRRQPRILTRDALCPLSRVSAPGHRQAAARSGFSGHEHEHAFRLAHGTVSKSLMERIWHALIWHVLNFFRGRFWNLLLNTLTSSLITRSHIRSWHAIKFAHDAVTNLCMTCSRIRSWRTLRFAHLMGAVILAHGTRSQSLMTRFQSLIPYTQICSWHSDLFFSRFQTRSWHAFKSVHDTFSYPLMALSLWPSWHVLILAHVDFFCMQTSVFCKGESRSADLLRYIMRTIIKNFSMADWTHLFHIQK